MLGVWLASEFAISLPLCVAVAGLMLLLLVVCLLEPMLRRRYRVIMSCATMTMFCALGVLLVYVNNPYVAENHYAKFYPTGSQLSGKLRIVDTPQEKAKTMGVVAELEQCNDGGGWCETSGKLMLYVAKDSLSRRLRYGDCLEAELTLAAPNGALNPCQFDYRKFLYRKGIAATAYLKTGAYEVYDNQSHGLIGWCKQSQSTLVDRLRQSELNDSYKGFAEAMLLGWKHDVDEGMEAQFRDAGIMHLLCVSGLHVGLVTAMIGACLFFVPRTRWWNLLRVLLQLAGTWAFVCVSGLSPAAVRAGVMFSIYVIGNSIGRLGNNLNALAFAALILVCVEPWCLFNVSFQLSFVAVLGIMLLCRPLYTLLQPNAIFQKNRIGRMFASCLDGVWELVCLSMSAQFVLLPLLLYYFHQFPIYFLIANILIVPFAGLLLLGILLVVMTLHWGIIGTICAKVVSALLFCVDFVTKWVSGLRGAMIENIYCDVPLALLCAVFVMFTILLVRTRKVQWCAMSFVALLGMVVYATMVDIRCERNRQLVVYADAPVPAVEVFLGKESVLFVDAPLRGAPDALSYQREGLLLHNKVQRTYVCGLDTVLRNADFSMDRGELSFSDTKILMIGNTNKDYWIRDDEMLQVNYLVVGDCGTYDMRRILKTVSCDTVAIGCGGKPWKMNGLLNLCQERNLPCKDLRNNGALVFLMQNN